MSRTGLGQLGKQLVKPLDEAAQMRGRPSRGFTPSAAVAVGLTVEELAVLQRISREDGVNMSYTVRGGGLAAWLGSERPPILRNAPLPDADPTE